MLTQFADEGGPVFAIQELTMLTTEGFYSGSTTGMLDLKTHNALKAFQASNGLRQTGAFDRPTAEKLTPFIPKPGEEPPVRSP